MNKKLILFSAVAILTLPAASVFAEEQTTTATGSRQQVRTELREQREENQSERIENRQQLETKRAELAQKRLEFQDRKEKMVEEKCKNIENKISTRVNRYQNNAQMLEKVYANMQARVERLLARLKSAGADTTQLEKDFALLKTKVEKLKTDQATFMSTLKDSQTFACGKSEGEFKAKITEARKVPEIIKQDREDIKKFFQTTIKADLEAIKTKLATTKETTEATQPETIQ